MGLVPALCAPLSSGYDTSLMTAVLGVFTRTVFAFWIQRARDFGAERGAQCGAVTFIQRFGSALNLKKRS